MTPPGSTLDPGNWGASAEGRPGAIASQKGLSYRFSENGTKGFTSGEGGIATARKEFWTLDVSPTGPDRSQLRWVNKTGSQEEKGTRTLVRRERGIEGTSLPNDLHGPLSDDLAPAPLQAPLKMVKGQVFSGRALASLDSFGGQPADYEIDHGWELRVVGPIEVRVGDRPIRAWKLERRVVEAVMSKSEGNGRWEQDTEEIYDPSSGLVLRISGRERETEHPQLIYDVTFLLEAEGLKL